jgi:hypothetical protein
MKGTDMKRKERKLKETRGTDKVRKGKGSKGHVREGRKEVMK